MWNLNRSQLTVICLNVSLLGAAVPAMRAVAQSGPKVHVNGTEITGFPEDWSHKHVVFSNPGTEADAFAKGTHDHWQNIVNNPRYVMQQMKHNRKVEGPAGIDADYLQLFLRNSRDSRDRHGKKDSTGIARDWSEVLGGPGLADGQYPSKYNYYPTFATCTDYVVFPTGAAGSSSQATIVAFNSLYSNLGSNPSGCPLNVAGKPVVYWAYNTGTGYTANTSPVLSIDGTQVAFVQTNGTNSQLVLLKMAASGGTVSSPATPSNFLQTNANYRTCTAPCYTTITLGATSTDTFSAPFYVFDDNLKDDMFVGDDKGKMHEITGAFSGTPAFDTHTGWPVTISTNKLYSPVFDDGTSQRLFVTDQGGFLYSFTISAADAPGTVGASGQLENGVNTTGGVFEAPLVDSTNEWVYTFVGYSGDAGTSTNQNPSYINYFPAGTALSGGFGSSTKFSNGNPNGTTFTTNPKKSHMRAGSFDDEYYESNPHDGVSGHLYVCENGQLYQITVNGGTTPGTLATTEAATPFSTLTSTVGDGGTAACSPVTEFLGTKVRPTSLTTTVAASGAVTVGVASGTGIANGDYIQIDSEIMQVNSGGGTTSLGVLSTGRGLDGTTAAAHTPPGVAVTDVQDWIFVSVVGNGNVGQTGPNTCTGACVYNFSVIGASGTANKSVDGLAATGGTSGIVIDTSSTTLNGDQEIYYTQLGGTSAIQASQSALQ